MDHRPTVVLKVGTSSLVDTTTGITHVATLARLAEVAMRLTRSGYAVIIVSSGAVGLGCSRMGLKSRPTTVAGKQAAAAVGQVRLMSLYDDVFSVLGLTCAQVLLTYDTFGERTQYLNARNTFMELLRLGAIPVVNENDTIATQEIRVGDNDTLSALVAAMVGASWLMLLTDVEALYTANPRADPGAGPIRLVPTQWITSLRKQMSVGVPRLVVGPWAEPPPAAAAATTAAAAAADAAGGAGSQWGTGGMATKLKAAQLATAAGVAVLITLTSAIERVEGLLVESIQPWLAAHGGGSGSGPDAGGKSRSTSPTRAAPAAGTGGGGGASPGRASLSTAGAAAAPAASAQPAVALSPTVFVDAGVGTTFLPAPKPVTGRKRWILSLAPQGSLTLDDGAVAAVRDQRKSLFPAGVSAVTGDFDAQDAVVLVTPAGVEVARALVNYSAAECRRLVGRRSKEIGEVLGYLGAEALADRDNVVILQGPRAP